MCELKVETTKFEAGLKQAEKAIETVVRPRLIPVPMPERLLEAGQKLMAEMQRAEGSKHE